MRRTVEKLKLLALALVASISLVSCAAENKDPLIAPADVRPQSIEKEIVFGTQETFRLGDGEAFATACQEELEGFASVGSVFEMEFEVIDDFTRVTTKLENVCGVDLENNLVEIRKDKDIFALTHLTPDATEATLQPVILEKGVYKIRIESGLTLIAGDWKLDDFLVGQVRLTATKAIKEVSPPNGLVIAERSEEVVLGDEFDYLLGDARGPDATCDPLEGQGTLQDQLIFFEFKVEAEQAHIGIELEDVCGVDFSTNWVEIQRTDNSVLLKYLLPVNTENILLPGIVLPKGDYRFRIISQPEKQGSDFDDFVVGSVRLFHSGGVVSP